MPHFDTLCLINLPFCWLWDHYFLLDMCIVFCGLFFSLWSICHFQLLLDRSISCWEHKQLFFLFFYYYWHCLCYLKRTKQMSSKTWFVKCLWVSRKGKQIFWPFPYSASYSVFATTWKDRELRVSGFVFLRLDVPYVILSSPWIPTCQLQV